MQNVEIIETISTSVSCSGKESPYDHPRIYLEIDSTKGYIMCPYCSKKFVLSNEDKAPIR
ncbi:zinc-finger domain-containing protein [Candidatus Tisiphia endosymbiont of Hybos culiciformis]|uniref:zinc-finger domain-containing protein n=1 Tax=Candidatus Tisiphia endosymbiont of Hybos culiciformis TaxID=3139331 RepID=UPI003CCAF000